MAIVVTAHGTVDDIDTNELYAFETQFFNISKGDPVYLYNGQGNLYT
jgi:hypothetical protein